MKNKLFNLFRKRPSLKKQLFNSSELGLLSTAFLKNLIPKPTKGELYSKCGNKDGSCYLAFESSYHNKIDLALRGLFYEGNFLRSNSEKEWNSLMLKINTAESTSEGIESFELYWLSAD
jgi:hypothetical protein